MGVPRLSAQISTLASRLKVAGAHHYFDGEDYYADTAFINDVQHVVPGAELKHLGFGEFYLDTPEGQLEFDRMRGKDFPGQSGRSHKLYDNKRGKLVEKVIELMERKRKSKRVASRSRTAAELPGSVWDEIPERRSPFGWASPARTVEGGVPEPWRVSHKKRALAFLKKLFPEYRDLYCDYEPRKYRGKLQIWCGFRDNRDKEETERKALGIVKRLTKDGYPARLSSDKQHFYLVDDLERDVLR